MRDLKTLSDRDAPGPEARAAALTLVLFVAFIVAFSVLFRMDEAAHARGRFVVSGGNTPIQTVSGGKVRQVFVRDGQRVNAGQKLLVLDPDQLLLNERAAGETAIRLLIIRERYRAEKRRSPILVSPPELAQNLSPQFQQIADAIFMEQQRELDVARTGLATELQLNSDGRARLSGQLTGAAQQLALSEEQIRLLQDELDGLRRLQSQGFVATNKVRSLERAVAAQRAATAQVTAQQEDLRSQLAETRSRRTAIVSEYDRRISAELQEVELQIGRAAPELGSASLTRADSNVVAPFAGWVMELSAVGPGQVIAPGEKIMSIVPDRTMLVVEAAFPPQHASELRSGQRVDIRLSASGLNRGLVVSGAIQSVSPDVVVTPTGEEIIPATIGLSPDAWKRAAGSRHFGQLRAGTPVEVLAIVRRRSLLEYLFEPLAAGGWRAFREA